MWSTATVREILHNPKYTGYNVWNRHDKRRGRPAIKPRSEWTWCREPTYEAIVPIDLFDHVDERARANERKTARGGGRDHLGKQRGRSEKRIYSLRGRILCTLCWRRCAGSHQKGENYYRCQFAAERGAVGAERACHPASLQIAENAIFPHVFDFLGTRVFGEGRLLHLRDELAGTVAKSWQRQQEEFDRLRRELKQRENKLKIAQVRLFEHEDPNHPVVAGAKAALVELTQQKEALETQIAEVEAERRVGVDPKEMEAMLAAVPDLRGTIETLSPEELRAVRGLRPADRLQPPGEDARDQRCSHPGTRFPCGASASREERTGRWGRSE